MDSSFISLRICAVAIGFFMILGTLFLMVYKKFRSNQQNKTMPSSSHPSSLPSSLRIYDVFPSFHGADVRRSFLSHILMEFRRKGIFTFSNIEIERGSSIDPGLVAAIRESRIAIVMISRNYASSTWCLNELVEIIKCREVYGQVVVPVFYELDPSNVKKQTGDFGKCFKKTCKGKTREDIGKWRQALVEVANIPGYSSRNWRDEASLIEHIATFISNKLIKATPSRDFDAFVGMRAHMEMMERTLCLDLDEVRMIGILGPSGIGKTTVSRCLYNQLSDKFQLVAFMDNIKSRYPRPCLDVYTAQLHLQADLLSQLLNQKDLKFFHLGVLQEMLKNKKVLVVLDDVDSLEQLDALAKETQWYGPGSRIIITTQDPRLLKAHGIDHIYKVDFPTPDEALQIFCMYAFGHISPEDGFMKLAHEVIQLAGKLPLRLRVMGSHLRGMSKEEWKKRLPRLRTMYNKEIGNITGTGFSNTLASDYEGLVEMEADMEKTEEMVCLDSDEASMVERLVGMEAHMEKMKPMLCLDSLDSYEVRRIGIWGPPGIGKTTIAKFLYQQLARQFQWSTIMVNIEGFNASTCHNEPKAKLQLQIQLWSQLINQKVIDENFDLGVAKEMLKDKKVLVVVDNVDGLGLDALAKEMKWFGPGSRIIFTTQDQGLLKAHGIAHIYKVDFPTPDEALQIFCMYAFGQISPKDGFMELAHEVTTLSGKVPLGLRLMGNYLQGMSEKEWTDELPRLRTSLDGEMGSILQFSYDSLCDEDKEFCHHHIARKSNGETVEEYFAKSCSDVRQELIITNQELREELYISERAFEGMSNGLLRWECFPMKYWPSTLHPEYLFELYMPGSKLEKLWEGIRPLRKLRLMDLSSSKNLKELPDLSTAINLKRLDLSCCSSLVELTSSIGNATSLEELYLRCCSRLLVLPASIGNAINLQRLNLEYCSSLVNLPSSIGNAINLKELYLTGCSGLVELPASIGDATNLQKLNLEYCSSLVNLPSSIGNAVSLKELYLIGCSSLVELPASIGNATSLEILDLSNCSSLVDLPSSIGNVNSLHYFYLSNCSSLVLIPSSIGNATNLLELDLSNCSSLVELPSSIGEASGLRKLDLSNCSSLVELPLSIRNATNLEYLYLSNCSSLRKLPSSIGYATSLQYLYLNNCSNLMEIPYSIGNAINLKKLDLSWCTSLVKLPASIRNSTSLWQLDLDNCSNLLDVPDGIRLKKLDLSW